MGQLLVLSLLLVYAALTDGWTWGCSGRMCVRRGSPKDFDPLATLETCRLTCGGKVGALWPEPTGQAFISENSLIAFDPSRVSFDASAVAGYSQGGPVNDLVNSMIVKFVDDLKHVCNNSCFPEPAASVAVSLVTSSQDIVLNWSTDESYALELSSSGVQVSVRIQADSVYGARHGLETLSQLIAHSGDQLFVVSKATVHDEPGYPHRGLLVDTSRHFLPVSAIKRTLDGMAAVKLNTLHWHVTDTHSFPLLLPRVPQLALYGAYSSDEMYTVEEVKDLVYYAKVRGVRILMEIDMPAHAGNGWQDLSLAVCVNAQPWRQYCLQPPCGQLNPANQSLYYVLSNVFRDIIDLLPSDDIFHMGGDEVFLPCWNQTQEVTDWMRSQGRGLSTDDFLAVWGEFHQKALAAWDRAAQHSRTDVLLWSSHLTDPQNIERYLDKSRFVIETWVGSRDPVVPQLLSLGYRLILATQDAWYLDHGFWGGTRYYNWRKVYDNLLPRHEGVLGGEAAAWGELIDQHNLDSRVWPRAAALAERLWTDPETPSSVAEHRLAAMRRRLVARGLRPEAITPEWCEQDEGLCDGSANTL